MGLRVQSLASSLVFYPPGQRVIIEEVGSHWFCLGLPESKAGASGRGASSGGGVCVPHLLSGILSDERLVCGGGRCPVGTPCQPPSPSYSWHPRMGVCVRKCHLIWGD